MSDGQSSTIMERLKESTARMHSAAESSPFQGHLAKGQLPVDLYADYLEQLYLIHKTLEAEIARHGQEGAQFARAVKDDQLQEDFLKRDLQAMKRDLEKVKALPATRKILDSIARFSASHPVALVGMHYVLLGSKHGGKFVAKSCQESYQFPDGVGVLYFDPYGNNFMPVWKSFKESVNEFQLSDAESESMCEAAGLIFAGIGEIGAELLAATAAKAN